MRFSTVVAVSALVASASAGSIFPRQIPGCATPCLAPLAQETSSCSLTDNACLCKDEKFVAASTQCIVNECDGDDLTTALAASQSICKAFGITLTGTTPTRQATSSTPAETGSASITGSATTEGTGAASSPSAGTATKTSSGSGSTATSPSGSSTGSSTAPAASQSSNAALPKTFSGAVAGLVAVGVAALAL